MDVKNAVMPNEAQIKGFFEPAPDGPIYMVNLLKFKPRAEPGYVKLGTDHVKLGTDHGFPFSKLWSVPNFLFD